MGLKYEETCQQNPKLCDDRRLACLLEASSSTQIAEEASRPGGMTKDEAERYRQRCISKCHRPEVKNR